MIYYDTLLEFDGASLLSKEEAKKLLTVKDREYKTYWWLFDKVSYINKTGNVSYCLYDALYCVRPALNIKNLGAFKIGDTFDIDGIWEFKIISEQKAWLYKQDIHTEFFLAENPCYSPIEPLIKSWYSALEQILTYYS